MTGITWLCHQTTPAAVQEPEQKGGGWGAAGDDRHPLKFMGVKPTEPWLSYEPKPDRIVGWGVGWGARAESDMDFPSHKWPLGFEASDLPSQESLWVLSVWAMGEAGQQVSGGGRA